MKRIPALLLICLLAAGCSWLPGRGAKAPPPTATPAAPPGPTVPAADLLPRPDTPYSFLFEDGTTAEEYYIQDGNRLIGTYNGTTYITWFITDSGVWRRDPKGTALLRYLPPVLKDGAAWKQTSGSDEVWFQAKAREQCDNPVGGRVATCWELTVLNRGERTLFRFAPGQGVLYVSSENLQDAKQSYTKTRRVPPANVPVPDKNKLIRDGVPWTTDPLPAVMEVTPADFDAAWNAMMAKAGRTGLNVDLNGDGKPERIEGKLGEWQTGPIALFDSNGKRFEDEFPGPNGQHRLDVMTVPGLDRPALVYQAGQPDTSHYITFMWLEGNHLTAWHLDAKMSEPSPGTDVKVEPDGTVVITDNPPGLGGYTLIRRFRVERRVAETVRYQVDLVSQSGKPGAYPTKPEDLLAAAFAARWYDLKTDLARYIPDQVVRTAFLQKEIAPPMYYPTRTQLGKLTFKANQHAGDPYAEIASAPPGPDGATEFLVSTQEYEGGSYFTGKVTFGKEADGRLVIQKFELGKSGWAY